ncbi:MAG: plastocyanin/azurin family copper-binding protein [Thermodesulfobacteriota bacterium]
MKPSWFRRLVLLGLFLPAVAFGGQGSGGKGVVKGTISIGGRPATDAVVSIEGLAGKNLGSQISKLKFRRVRVEQRDRRFIPRVLAVIAGRTVDFPNNDDVWHNVFSTSEAKKFDLGLYPPGKTRKVTFDKPGVVRILCNVHPEMEAYVVVKEHPFFAVSDSRGNYRIDAVPVGRYRLEIWHPELGTRVEPFNMVRGGEVLAVDVDLKK